MAERAVGKYPKPKDGWVCFYCGERFTTLGGARDHFGFNPCDDPACRIKLGDERGLVREMRKAQALADSRLNRALNSERECEDLACQVSSLSDAMKSYKPFRECRSIQEVFQVYDSMEGRALAAEEERDALQERLKRITEALWGARQAIIDNVEAGAEFDAVLAIDKVLNEDE